MTDLRLNTVLPQATLERRPSQAGSSGWLAALEPLIGARDRRTERAYRRSRVAYRISNTRFTAIVVALMWSVFTVLDALLLPEQTRAALAIRMAGAGLSLLTVALTYAKRPGRWIEAYGFAYLLINIGLVFALKLTIPPDADPEFRSLALFMLVGTAGFVVTGTTFREGCVAAIVSCLGYALAAGYYKPETPRIFAYELAFLICSFVLAAINAFLLEATARRLFLQSLQLQSARDRAEVLVAEINHRVGNSLMLATSLVRTQMRATDSKEVKRALEETSGCMQAIAQMHRHLFGATTSGDVAVDEYLETVLSHLGAISTGQHSGLTLTRWLEPLLLSSSEAVNVGIVVTEWVTNAFKYAYPDGRGEVRVRLTHLGDAIEVSVEDDGVGRPDTGPAKGTGLGANVVDTIARIMRAEIRYLQRDPGTLAKLRLPLASPAADRGHAPG